MPGQSSALAEDQDELLGFLRTRGVSIKELDPKKKEELRAFLDQLHNGQGLSLNDISKLIGNKTSGYTSWLCRQLGVPRRPFEEARLKGIREKRRKYKRTPFDGTDEDRAYLLGLRHGDLSVSTPWKGAVRVSTSTTHPAMAKLFHELFGAYGHVYQHPRYKKDTSTYEWNLSTILDSSFGFLLQEFPEAKTWLSSTRDITLSYLSGLLDAEGSIVTTRDNRGLATIFLDYYNSDKILLDWVKNSFEMMGHRCSLRINKKEGIRTKKYGIVHRKDYWQLSTFGIERVQDLLRTLKPRHQEKIRRCAVALGVSKGDAFFKREAEIVALRSAIKSEVVLFVKRAEEEFLAKHQSSVRS